MPESKQCCLQPRSGCWPHLLHPCKVKFVHVAQHRDNQALGGGYSNTDVCVVPAA